MKKVIAYIPAWGFYWLGHLVSKPMHWSQKFEILFPIYSHLMNWSVFFNDWADLNVWIDSKEIK